MNCILSPTDKHTLLSKNFDNIFVLGDATDLPSSKAGSVAHFQVDTLAKNIIRRFDEKELLAEFDGHANCFIESGFGKGILIDFNYDTEPLPGKIPCSRDRSVFLAPGNENESLGENDLSLGLLELTDAGGGTYRWNLKCV